MITIKARSLKSAYIKISPELAECFRLESIVEEKIRKQVRKYLRKWVRKTDKDIMGG